MTSLLIPFDPLVFIFIISGVASAILAILNKMLVDQDRLKEIQKYVADHNKRQMKAHKEKNDAELKALEPGRAKVMQMQHEMMKMQMPVFASLLPFFAVFIVLGKIADANAWGEFITLPWGSAIPLFGMKNGVLGWLGWYILCSFPLTTAFRKALRLTN